MTLFGGVASDSALADQVILGLNNFRKGVTAPADSTIGTTPTTPAVLFAATNELLTIGTLMPDNWDRTVDVQLVLAWALAAAETNLDTLDLTCDYTVPQYAAGGGPDRASTQVTGQIIAVTGRLAQFDPYQMVINLARADANNPYTSTLAFGFAIEIHLTNIAQVASAHLLGGCINYERLH